MIFSFDEHGNEKRKDALMFVDFAPFQHREMERKDALSFKRLLA